MFNFGFTVGNQVGTPLNIQTHYSKGASIDTSPKVHQSPSANIGLNHFESGSTLQRPRRGGRFNIWRTTEEPNEGHHSDSGDKD